MIINIDRNSSSPIYLQITSQIREMILSGTLPEGYKLPPERKLAEVLEVNRSTVLNAYRELKADGFIGAHIGQGTVVLPVVKNNIQSNDHFQEPLQWRQLFSQNASRMREPLLRDLMELASRDDVISFAAGIADPNLYPLEEIDIIQQELIRGSNKAAFLHNPTEGYYPLRESISQMMRARGVFASPEEILVTSGAQQGLDVIARAFLDPGDIVIVEEPAFFCALQIFRASGARLIGVPMDDAGMRADILESLLTRYKPKLIYTLPTFQNPSGAVMDLERRRQLLDLAWRYQIPILEDDPYGELRYEGNKIPSLKAMDHHGCVLYLSTFSKIMFPGLRIGWLTASKPVIRQLGMVKQMEDLHAGSLAQCIYDEFLRKGLLEQHIKKVNKEYLLRRNAMISAMERFAPDNVSWNKPLGGFYIWCTVPETMIKSRLLMKAAEKKVAFVPGDAFYIDEQVQNQIRLNFSYHPPELIHEGVRRLMEAIEETLLEEKRGSSSKNINMKPIV
ncbi:MAG: PLP-dependent aminotransferase family protein [Clostridia bacterium]|nr:PLP-dependent aminotransferase family protein [Clostridia bacterium]